MRKNINEGARGKSLAIVPGKIKRHPCLRNIPVIMTLALIFFCAAALQAQQLTQRMGFEISGGAMRYGGSMPSVDTKAAVSFGLHYELTDNIHLQLIYTASEAGGGDSALVNLEHFGNDIRSNTYYFRSNINEITLTASYDFFNLNEGFKFTPFVLAGGGLYNFKPYQVVEYKNDKGALRKENRAMEQVEHFSNWQVNIPLGVGIKWGISPNTQLKLEGKYRILFNPYLDNFIADGKNDHFYSISLGFIFRLSKISGGRSRTGRKDCNCPPVY